MDRVLRIMVALGRPEGAGNEHYTQCDGGVMIEEDGPARLKSHEGSRAIGIGSDGYLLCRRTFTKREGAGYRFEGLLVDSEGKEHSYGGIHLPDILLQLLQIAEVRRLPIRFEGMTAPSRPISGTRVAPKLSKFVSLSPNGKRLELKITPSFKNVSRGTWLLFLTFTVVSLMAVWPVLLGEAVSSERITLAIGLGLWALILLSLILFTGFVGSQTLQIGQDGILISKNGKLVYQGSLSELREIAVLPNQTYYTLALFFKNSAHTLLEIFESTRDECLALYAHIETVLKAHGIEPPRGDLGNAYRR